MGANLSRSYTSGGDVVRGVLKPNGTQRELALAQAIHVPYQRVNDIIHGRRGIMPSTALRLARFFGMSPDFWLNLQMRWDLYFAQRDELPAHID